MSRENEILEGAIFVADSHFPTHGNELLSLLHKIDSGELATPQLFLMGDIFDLLIGGVKKSYTPNKEAISLIESISKNTQVYYFEGNHDFQLKKIFTNIKIFTREQQPQYMVLSSFVIGLSHGDIFGVGLGHNVMSKILRKPFVLSLLRLIKPNIIEQKTIHLESKEICHKIKDFETKAKEIFDSYKGAYKVIEGHYHQAAVFGNYISLPSLACQKQVGVVRGRELTFVSIKDFDSP